MEQWTVLRTSNTQSRETGKDIIATKRDRELWLSVKGWPDKSSNTQARHWFSGALFDLVLYRTENPTVSLAIGLPGGFRTYESLLPRVRWLRQQLPFEVYFVAQSGAVSIVTPHG